MKLALARPFFFTAVMVLSLTSFPFAATLVPVSTNLTLTALTPGERRARDIHNDVFALADEEKLAEGAVTRLKAEPRADIIAVLQDDLKSQPMNPPALSLKAAVLLNARELLPTLEELVTKTDSWQVFVSATQLAVQGDDLVQRAQRERLAAIYLKRLDGLMPATSQIAVLDGLGEFRVSISREKYLQLLGQANFQARVAAVRNFLAARESLSATEQVLRFRAAFLLKPYQARLPAMKEFAKFDAKLKAALRGAIPDHLCASESRTDVKAACEQLIGGPK
jgi:hypothetical protein